MAHSPASKPTWPRHHAPDSDGAPATADLAVFRRHGGCIAAAEALFTAAPRPWLDLSTGINPHAYPVPKLPRSALQRLPDPEAVAALEATAATRFGVSPRHVAAIPGSEIALRLLPRLLGAGSVALSEPTYGGHREAWQAVGARIVGGDTRAEARVVVNPNNPDGRITDPRWLLDAARDAWVIVDEAFVDCRPHGSVAPHAGGRLVVLRSFGKFFGLPGLRLGFVVAEPALAAQVREALGDWPLTAPTIAAGRAAYADLAWSERMRRRLARDAGRLDALLGEAGLKVLGGTELFRLAAAENADAIFLRLARAGILCRPFATPGLLRFGLPGSKRDWIRLQNALMGERS